MSDATDNNAEYRCPGEKYPISRAVHLGRLARFYPACRDCPHRHDTGVLSPRQAKRLQETARRGRKEPLFRREEIGGVALGQLSPGTVRDVAVAFGICLQRNLLVEPAPSEQPEVRDTVVVVAGDGRPAVAELVAAACGGLRLAGCHVVDLGAASAACLMFTADQLGVAGGLLVGSGQGGLNRIAVKLFGPEAAPLSQDSGLDVVRGQWEHGIDRPTRRFGGAGRFQAETPYLDLFRPYYHALRPLRFVLDSACPPVETYLDRLLADLACRAVVVHAGGENLPEQVIAEESHFGIHVDDDGERCRVVDELGHWVATDRLLALLASQLPADASESKRVLALAPGIEWSSADVPGPAWEVARLRDASSRSAVAAAMRQCAGTYGADLHGRLWSRAGGVPVPDALHTLTQLLALLSRSDRPFSVVLDREAAGHQNRPLVMKDEPLL